MPYVIRLLDAPGKIIKRMADPAGMYVASGDADAHDGMGSLTGTRDIRKALRFAKASEAFAWYQTQSKVRPLRDDGKPNRPFTAFTVTVEEVA
jgi:hypothetical protein